jgi:hypothetical protein
VIVQGTSVGLDVHALSVVAHAIDEETGKIARARLCPDHGEVLGWLHQLRSPVRVTYEAGPTGFGLARAITEAGMQCLVAAPSKLQRPAGDRIKTDARDAAHLARLLRLGEITEVRVPEREIEAVRDLVRAREDARADLMRVRHRLSNCFYDKGSSTRAVRHGPVSTKNGYAGTASPIPTSKRPSTMASTPCSGPPRHGIASTTTFWRWPPRRGSPTRSTAWAAYAASPR